MFRLAVLLVVLGLAQGAPTLNHPDVRIINGHNTTIELHPYQVSLQTNYTHFCGGILISPEWVLTAALCITELYDTNLSIRAGSTNRSSGGQSLLVSKAIVHPNWNFTKGMDNNIAALQLAGPVTMATAGIATLPVAGATIATDDIVTITGWGETDTSLNNKGTDILQETQSPVIPHEQCTRVYNSFFVTDNMFCAGMLELKDKIVSPRDAGGPAVINNTVVAVTSMGLAFLYPEFPGIYLKISPYRDWISQTCGV